MVEEKNNYGLSYSIDTRNDSTRKLTNCGSMKLDSEISENCLTMSSGRKFFEA